MKEYVYADTRNTLVGELNILSMPNSGLKGWPVAMLGSCIPQFLLRV